MGEEGGGGCMTRRFAISCPPLIPRLYLFLVAIYAYQVILVEKAVSQNIDIFVSFEIQILERFDLSQNRVRNRSPARVVRILKKARLGLGANCFFQSIACP